jgi:hypothetical protein
MTNLLSILLFVTCTVLLIACDDSGDSRQEEDVVFHFQMLGDVSGLQDFRATTDDPVIIAAARAQLQLPTAERGLFIIGDIERGNGDHNLDWNWHFLPDRWELAEVTIELCDGNAVLVSQAVDYWVDTVGRFCPWGARVTEEIDGP